MFWHNFKYSLKSLFRLKVLIFWTFAFPIILSTLFNLAMSDLDKPKKLDTIDIAVVENTEFQENLAFKGALQELSTGDKKNKLFNIQYVEETKAKDLLEDNKISGYLLFNQGPEVIVAQNGIEQTVIKYVVDEIAQINQTFETVIEQKITENIEITNNSLSEEQILTIVDKTLTKLMKNREGGNNIINSSPSNLSYTMVAFYTVIAMSCMYGGIISMESLSKTLPNMSEEGKRVTVTPIPRWKLILSTLCSSYIVQILALCLLFLYMNYVIKVDFGGNTLTVILLSLVGSLAGLSLGVFIESMFNFNEKTKTGLVIGITMLGSFLSGMMQIQVKYYVDTYLPLLSYINPVRMITDGFYALYYYETLERYYFNLISLLTFSIILISISIFKLRRQRYDSI